MAIKKSELYSSLWASCDELRGGMDASQYKDYVLVLLFIKYISDKYAGQPFAPIQIPEGAISISVSADGTVSAQIDGTSEASQLGQLTIASFANPAGLQASSDNYMLETSDAGAAQLGIAGDAGRGQIRQGMLEGSNVNIVEELVDMIEAQRAYEINSKMISAVDEMLRNANQTL